MRAVFAIAGLNLRELFRDRTELVSVIALPLLLTWVFGAAFGSQGVERPVAIPLADADASSYSKAFVADIAASAAFEVEPMTAAEARTKVREGDAPISVVIPAGFGADIEAGEPLTIEVRRFPGSDRAQAAVQVVEGAVTRIEANAAAARVTTKTLAEKGADAPTFRESFDAAAALWKPDPPVGVAQEVVQPSATRAAEQQAPSNTQYSLGFTVFFVLMTALGSASSILEERELGTIRRLLATPVTRTRILLGKVLGVAVVATFEAGLLVGFGALVFKVPWGQDPVAITVVLLAFILASTGLGIMISALARTRSQVSAVVPIVSTGLAMLGGCYWPVEVTSPLMQQIARFTPTGWAMVALKDVVARGLGLDAVLVPCAVLFAFAAVALGIGISRLRLE